MIGLITLHEGNIHKNHGCLVVCFTGSFNFLEHISNWIVIYKQTCSLKRYWLIWFLSFLVNGSALLVALINWCVYHHQCDRAIPWQYIWPTKYWVVLCGVFHSVAKVVFGGSWETLEIGFKWFQLGKSCIVISSSSPLCWWYIIKFVFNHQPKLLVKFVVWYDIRTGGPGRSCV